MKKIFLTLWWLVLSVTAQATLLTPETPSANLLSSVQYLEDPKGQLSLQDVQGMGDQFKRWEGGGTELNFGFTDSAYWIRVPLQRLDAAPRYWLLELHYAKISQLDFYSPNAAAVHTGSNAAFSSRPYFDRNFVLPIEVTPDLQHFYMRVTSGYALSVPLGIWRPDSYHQQQQRFQFLQFAYYGGLIVLAMYGLVIYLSIRDRRFLIYCAYIVTVGMGIFASNGYGRQLLWPDAPAFDEIAQSTLLSLAAYFAVLFARILLLPAQRSWLTYGMRWSQYMFLLTALLTALHMVWPGLLRPANQLLMLSCVVMGILVSGASLQAYLQKRPGIRFFLWGWLLLWVGVTIAALRAFGWIPSNGFTSYAVQLSTVFEMVLMALALGELLRIEHEAHNASQQQALEANRALLELTQASEENLKHAVKQRTLQLEASLKLEKELREQYVRFGSMISHEFRTPLSIIQGQASLMRKENEMGINEVPKRAEVISSATQRLAVMFDKWLQSDAITQTLEALALAPLELQPWLRALLQTNAHILLNHRVTLDLHPQSIRVLADEYHLGIAVTNLIDNAAKYSPAESTITIETRFKEGYVGIAVTDQGSGIPSEMQEKVFSEFFRVAPESHIRGVGLGLAIVQRIIRAHGGHVTLTSTLGHGATFCLWLPAYDTD